MIGRRALLGAAGASLLAPRLSLAAPPSPGLLRLRAPDDVEILDPCHHNGYLEEEIIRAVYVTLVQLDDFRGGLSWRLAAAEELVWLGPLRLRFRLREGLRWSGAYGPVTAEDVKYSFERILDPAAASPWISYFDAVEKIELEDARTGILHFHEPRPSFIVTALPWYGGHIVCRRAMEELAGRRQVLPPAVCGAYRIEEWRPTQEITLAANPDWTGQAPEFKRVRISLIPDQEVAALAYQAGSFDFTRVSVSTLSVIQKWPLPMTRVIARPGNSMIWISLNMENPKLADPRVRRAVQRAINLKDIIDGAYAGIARPATGIIPEGMIGCRPANIYRDGDPEAARLLLAEAGVKALRLTLSVINDTVNMTLAQIVQANLRDAGIELSIKSYDAGTYWTLGDASLGEQWRDLELVLMSISGGVDPGDNTPWFLSDQVGKYNWSRFSDEEFDSLHHRALIEEDPARRAADYRRMQDIMEESGGFKFLTFGIYAAVHSSAVEPCILADGYLDIARFHQAY